MIIWPSTSGDIESRYTVQYALYIIMCMRAWLCRFSQCGVRLPAIPPANRSEGSVSRGFCLQYLVPHRYVQYIAYMYMDSVQLIGW